MALQTFDPNDEESFDKLRDLFSPAQVDQSVRQALQLCWMLLPQEKRNIDELEQQFRRIVDRALKNMRDDDQAFGGQ
ncbi:hypothetical protein [Gimesia sp.]|uniref:hypothetical protein n=1 Tax=Gimesia sp. TaxID=2024833 RepID=UPI003A915386